MSRKKKSNCCKHEKKYNWFISIIGAGVYLVVSARGLHGHRITIERLYAPLDWQRGACLAQNAVGIFQLRLLCDDEVLAHVYQRLLGCPPDGLYLHVSRHLPFVLYFVPLARCFGFAHRRHLYSKFADRDRLVTFLVHHKQLQVQVSELDLQLDDLISPRRVEPGIFMDRCSYSLEFGLDDNVWVHSSPFHAMR